MAVAGGMILLMGLFLVYDYTGTLILGDLKVPFQTLGNIKYVIAGLIITGFGVKAGMFPLHGWLPKAYTAAPTPATAVLSGILKKTGIFGILITSEFILGGDIKVSFVLLVLGLITMLLGGFFAMFQRNIKRILAYSSMSQMGYIILGISLMGLLGEDKAIAFYGTIYHVINHAIFKVLLFMCAGLIYIVLHELSINEISGFGRKKYILKTVFLVGLCAIIGMPGFAGFTSKTLLHHAVSEAHHIYGGWFVFVEILFTLSSAFTVAYLLKIFIAVFVEENQYCTKKLKMEVSKKLNRIAFLPMCVLAALLIYIGMKPEFIMNILGKASVPFNVGNEFHSFDFYSLDNIKTSLLTILLGFFIYVAFVRTVLIKGDREHRYYDNLVLNWFNINTDFFRPLGRFLIIGFSVILKIIDESLTTTALLTTNAIEVFGRREIEVPRNSSSKASKRVRKALNVSFNFTDMNDNLYSEKDVESITHILEGEEKLITTIKGEFNRLRNVLNSVTYSIFVFAIVLIVILLVMLL
jgi:formate hydrogenlyase subunit 3/multisubunit Na+/H+ antiporter MnhD subunit